LLDAQFIVVSNKITAVLIDLTQSAVSSDISWYVFLFICASLEGTLEQPCGTSELLFLIIITAIINTVEKNIKKYASLKCWGKHTKI